MRMTAQAVSRRTIQLAHCSRNCEPPMEKQASLLIIGWSERQEVWYEYRSAKTHRSDGAVVMLNKAETSAEKKEAVVIKKYANRRLYNTETSTYVTLDDLAAMVRNDKDFVVYDAKTGDDLTHTVLTQIIVEQESREGGQNLLPIPFLRQLIRFYDDSIGRMVPGYLQF